MNGNILSYKDDTEAFYLYLIDKERTPDDIRQIYDEWAKDYDKTMEAGGYEGPTVFVEEFDKLGLSKDSKILDACCGTGILGKLLKSKGYTNLHGLDCSPGMLSMAKSQNIYKSYEECFLTEGTRTTYSDGYFDAVVMCGVVAPSHLGAEAFPELIRITKPGGIIAWLGTDVNRWFEKLECCKEFNKNFYQKIANLVDDNKWKEYKERVNIAKIFSGEPGYVQFMQVVQGLEKSDFNHLI